MTREEVYAAQPGPELDALVHRYYGDGSPDVPPYSTDWETASRLAHDHDLVLRGEASGGHVIMSLFRDGQYLEVGDSIDFERGGEIDVPPTILATLAARSLLKLAVHRPIAS